MEIRHKPRVGLRAFWVMQGLAIASLCAAPGLASADVIFVAHQGKFFRPADVQNGTGTGTNTDTDDTGDGGNTYVNTGDGHNTDVNTDDGNNPGNRDPVSVPEPATLALLFAGLGGLLITPLIRRTAVHRID